MARPKLSYTKPQPNIWIRRRGFSFEYAIDEPKSAESRLNNDSDKILNFLREELTHGRRYTEKNLENLPAFNRMTRKELRAAIDHLEISGLVEDRELPKDERHGQRKTYLHPLMRQCNAAQ